MMYHHFTNLTIWKYDVRTYYPYVAFSNHNIPSWSCIIDMHGVSLSCIILNTCCTPSLLAKVNDRFLSSVRSTLSPWLAKMVVPCCSRRILVENEFILVCCWSISDFKYHCRYIVDTCITYTVLLICCNTQSKSCIIYLFVNKPAYLFTCMWVHKW